ncbi:MAG TPA: RDD family protein [Flavisolibacter sp.]
METIEKDILLDIQPELVQANTGKRLANYFVDLVAFYAVFFLLAVGYFAVSANASNDTGFNAGTEFLLRLFAFLLYGLFMGLLEGVFKGRSLGKLITGTKVVNEDGTDISFSTAMARGFSRIVPFEPFSALGNPSYPWHDRWNKTYVIDVRQSGLN